MKKLTVDDINMTPPGQLTITLNKRKDKIDRLEIIISLMDVRLKENIEQIEEQAAEIEKLKFCLGGALTDIEKLEDSIRAFESEQKDYEKTCVRLREEFSELNEKADEDFKFIENLEQENSRLKSEIAFLEEKIKC